MTADPSPFAQIAPIRTARLALRAPRTSDAGLISHYASDARVARMTSAIPHPYPPGAADAFVARALSRPKGEATWVIEGEGLSEVLGLLTLAPGGESVCEIGYWIAPAFWNAGIASEAVSALVEANPMGCRTVRASVFQDNPASARVLTGAGFAYVGDGSVYSVSRDAWVPVWTYALDL